MKPRNKKEARIFSLSKKIAGISNIQTKWAVETLFENKAFQTRTKLHCLECGSSWDSQPKEYNTLVDTVCPCCSKTLQVNVSRRRSSIDKTYFNIVTTKAEYQVVRMFFIQKNMKIGQKSEVFISEVYQHWIDEQGEKILIGKLASMNPIYCDLWIFNSSMEIRKGTNYRYNLTPSEVYPKIRTTSTIRRNGFKGNLHNISPCRHFTLLLKDSRAETMIKAKQYSMFRHLAVTSIKDEVWNAVKICIRNKFIIQDASLYVDYIELLQQDGKDIRNPKYICRADYMQEHDILSRKIAKAKKKRKDEEERKELQIQEKFAENEEEAYKSFKQPFFDLVLSDGEIEISVLKSVQEFREEAEELDHCVYSNDYYMKPESLILSAKVSNKRMETIEFSLDSFNIIQSRGIKNQVSEYHDKIINLMNQHTSLVQRRMMA